VLPNKQRIALNIGIISSFILRGIMIFSGGFLVNKYHWLSYVFGAFLLYSAGGLLLQKDCDSEPKSVINFVGKYLLGLSLFGVVIAVIELTDVLFALDSIPASFGVTSNPMIIYSANIFAILGLRSLYFVMLDMIERFTHLNCIVAIILSGVGAKMIVQTYMG
jgi:tellurite resistance protein TerC